MRPHKTNFTMKLSRKQIKRLRAEGHRLHLKPVVTIGGRGLSASLGVEIENALRHHELLKLRLPALKRADKQALANEICRQTQAELVEAIGNVIVIYRHNADKHRFADLLKD